MDFEQIKNLRPQNGEKYIIIENGKPVLVLMNFEDYKKSSSVQKKIDFKEKVPSPSPEKKEGELTLEDLPF